jgi:hypothetical protein
MVLRPCARLVSHRNIQTNSIKRADLLHTAQFPLTAIRTAAEILSSIPSRRISRTVATDNVYATDPVTSFNKANMQRETGTAHGFSSQPAE